MFENLVSGKQANVEYIYDLYATGIYCFQTVIFYCLLCSFIAQPSPQNLHTEPYEIFQNNCINSAHTKDLSSFPPLSNIIWYAPWVY